jgi:4-phosphopantoate--beta-alanine ligase
MKQTKISPEHPRAASLRIRERLIGQFNNGVVAAAGLLAHGRGEAFDYLLGEKTTSNALKAMKVAAALLLTAKRPVISVNGNAGALTARDIVKLAQEVDAKIEVNLFHRSFEREKAIENLLKEAGASQVLGVGEASSATIPEIASERRRVDPRGILIADVVLVPLEDGDRTEALVKTGKKVIAIDLNPLSRTAKFASVTIVDNIVRAMPRLTRIVEELRAADKEKLRRLTYRFDNGRNLSEATEMITERLGRLAQKSQKGAYLTILEEQRI